MTAKPLTCDDRALLAMLQTEHDSRCATTGLEISRAQTSPWK
jgi:hypothetical protein